MNTDPLAPPVSVVMPAYNEEGSIRDAVHEVERHILSTIPGSELLVVDDGSKDQTPAILDALAKTVPGLRVIHQANAGHGPALRRGMSQAKGEFLFLIDSDRQIPLDGFMAFWKERESWDAIFGQRLHRDDPRLRLVITRVLRLLLRLGFSVQVHDANVPFKLIRASVWKKAAPSIPENSLVPSLLLAVFISKKGYRLKAIETPHRARATGTVSIRRWKLLRFCGRAALELLTFRRALS